MSKFFPIQPIYLALLVVELYFLVVDFSVVALVATLISCVLLLRQYSKPCLLKTILILCLFASYFLFVNWKSGRDYQAAPEHLPAIHVIPDSISVNGDRLSFRGRYAQQSYQAFYRLKSETEKRYFQNLWQNTVIRGKIKLTEAEEQRNFKGFDYRAYLKTQKIYRLAQIESIDAVEKAKALSLFDHLRSLRRRAIVHIQSKFPAPMAHYMTGLLFGYLDNSFDEMGELYSSLGIIHLFALSGMQAGFFLGKFRYLLLRLGIKQETVNGLQIPFSVLYAVLTGGSVSVIRSLLQSYLALFNIRKLDNLALSLMVMFFLVPHFLATAGGVLSFAYAFILGLIDFEDLSGKRQLLAQTLAVYIGILPFLMWYFSSFQPVSILLTACLSFLFDVILLPLLSFLFLLSPLIGLSLLNPFFQLLEDFISFLGHFFSRSLILGSPSVGLLLMLVIGLGLLYDFYKLKKARVILSIALCFLFFLVKNPAYNEVTMVDVGQGDSVFLRDMKGKTLLIDVGGKPGFASSQTWQRAAETPNAERTLLPYLKNQGIGKIDQLVLTHTDTDHIGDLEAVAKELDIGEILVSQGSLTVPEFRKRLKTLAVPVRVLQAGDKLPIMGSQLQVLYPSQVGDGGNNDSLVLYGSLLGLRFLFTGDLEKEGEETLMAAYPKLPVDVLKAGHHGSKGSSSPAFLDFISPKLALISAGKNNRYRHPHQETLQRFEGMQTLIYRTDQMGAVRFKGIKQWQIEVVK